ncbi:MAG TPA: hypothetical protein VMG10_34460 [Gemmataceae bacterium]|nr:hypothetical protein [Gemmataceae bacterium]
MSSKKEFIIMGVVEGYLCRAIGRCCDVPIRLGDQFDAVYRYKPPATLEDYAKEPELEAEERRVSLRVEAIQSYERPVSHLSPGMTGTLQLSGVGCNFLGPGWVLGVSEDS